MQNRKRDYWTLWEKTRVGCFKRTASKHVYYLGWNRSPAQVGCMRQVPGPGALGRPRGFCWSGWWEGASGWGIHVTPWLIHVNVWQNPLQYCKVISLQLIKINKLKKKKVHLVKAVVLQIVTYGCENWTVKKAEQRRIDVFELWCLKTLWVPWTARRSNQSILKEISPEFSLEGLILKLKLQYFGHLMWRADSFEKTLMLGAIEGERRRAWQRARWLHGIIDSMDMHLNKLLELLMDRETWHAAVHGFSKRWTRLSNRTELNSHSEDFQFESSLKF